MNQNKREKDEIARLLQVLRNDDQKHELSTEAKLQNLSSLKSYIVSVQATELFTREDVRNLCISSFEERQHQCATAAVALKCLANLLLLGPKTRQYFVDEGYAPSAAKRLKGSAEDELLCSRILFLLTYDTDFDFEPLLKDKALASSIHKNITNHASHYVECSSKHRQSEATDSNPGALTESLKLLFNVNKFYPKHTPDFTQTITPILQILCTIQIQRPVLQQPVTALINSLLCLDLPGQSSPDPQDSREVTPLFPESSYDNCRCLIDILGAGTRLSKEEELDGLVPLVTLLRRVYELAPNDVKAKMQSQLLPSNDERSQPLGQSDSLASRLLRLSTAPTIPRLKEGISSFLFELSDQDTATFVRNVGYGFAAGYLMTHNLPVPQNVSREACDNVTTVDGQEINPITGQRRDMEPEDPLPEMTDEEKEREAERLFVLFERLKATGVMNVVNPVEQANDEGRFEDLD